MAEAPRWVSPNQSKPELTDGKRHVPPQHHDASRSTRGLLTSPASAGRCPRPRYRARIPLPRAPSRSPPLDHSCVLRRPTPPEGQRRERSSTQHLLSTHLHPARHHRPEDPPRRNQVPRPGGAGFLSRPPHPSVRPSPVRTRTLSMTLCCVGIDRKAWPSSSILLADT